MKYAWTPERVAALDKAELKNLHQNALDRGNTEIAALCQSQLDATVTRKRAPKGNASDLRTPATRRLEKEAADMLQVVAAELQRKYDLSPARARTLSEGTKKFIPHNLTDKAGKAKVGGAQRQGRVIFDRYISYRLKDDLCALSVIMLTDYPDVPQYQVIGSQRLIEGGVPITELRPFLGPEEVSYLVPVGICFKDFSDAINAFKIAIDRIISTGISG